LTPDTEEQVRGSAERKGGVSASPRSGPPFEGKLFPRPSVKQAIASLAQISLPRENYLFWET
jgi:hypothetical protein